MKQTKIKVAKVVPCFPFVGTRGNHNSPKTLDTWSFLFKKLIQGELESDPGVDTDVLLYYRTIPGDSQTGRELIYSYDGLKLPRGVVKVHEMPNDQSMGFSAILEFLKKHHKKYSHLVFQEDDIYILPGNHGYLQEAIDCNKDLVNLATMCTRYPGELHIAGMFALMRIEPLLPHLGTFPLMKQRNELNINWWVFESYNYKASDVGSLKTYKNYPRNSADAYGFLQAYVKAGWNDAPKFLYNVGIETGKTPDFRYHREYVPYSLAAQQELTPNQIKGMSHQAVRQFMESREYMKLWSNDKLVYRTFQPEHLERAQEILTLAKYTNPIDLNLAKMIWSFEEQAYVGIMYNVSTPNQFAIMDPKYKEYGKVFQ